MTAPQIMTALYILITAAIHTVDTITTGSKSDVTTSVIAAFLRALTLYGLLYWGGFWK